jgi:hypothetical protein
METPLILEFSSPIRGTFPLWYDPAYWYAGAKARLNLRQQIRALKRTTLEYQQIFSQRMTLLAGALVLFLLAARNGGFSRAGSSNVPRAAWLLLWPLTAMLLYALVHVEIRYIAAFCVLLWLAVYSDLVARLDRQAAVAVCATVVAAMMIPFTISVGETSISTVRNLARPTQPEYEKVALGLRNLGVRSGDSLAVVGFPFGPYYAHYSGTPVVATIAATDDFWNLSTPDWKSVADRLAGIGVKAVVAQNRPHNSTTANWKDLKISGDVQYSVVMLSEPLVKNSVN